MSSYARYVTDSNWLATYDAYQARYASTIRESDKVILRLVGEIAGDKPLAVLDVGCSTGNLLVHLKRLYPNLSLSGCELAESSLSAARGNPSLRGVRLEHMDMLDLKGQYDIVIANAVAVYFTWEEYEKALSSVARIVKPGGTYIAFEWLHPWANQDIVITETTMGHPEGLRICFRPMASVRRLLIKSGFSSVNFIPFELPIELAKPGYEEEVVSYTVNSDAGRLCFRGALAQPWCHMVAGRDLQSPGPLSCV